MALARIAGAIQRSGRVTYSGYAVSRGARVKPRASVMPRSRSTPGHGRSGFTWSMVMGETPPQSSMPQSSSRPKSSDRFGGACRWIDGGRITRAAATVQRYSSSGHAGALCIAVSAFGRKFWTITSWTWP